MVIQILNHPYFFSAWHFSPFDNTECPPWTESLIPYVVLNRFVAARASR